MLISVGMQYASEKPIFIKNRIDVPRTAQKSINNFVLELDKYYRNN